MRHFLVVIVMVWALCLAAPSLAFGDDFLKKEVFGAIGIGKTYDDEGSLGAGLNGGGGFGYRLSHRFGVEAEVNAFRTRREFSAGYPPFQANGAHLMGSGLLYLGRERTQAYLLFGGGLLHTRLESGFGGVPVRRSANGFAVNLGGGMKIFVSPHVSVRPELRIYAGNSRDVVEAPFGDIRFSIGVGYHW